MTSEQNRDALKGPARRIWLTLQAEEVLELKQLMMDHDVDGTRAFFQRVVVPRVREAAERRGMKAEAPAERLKKDVRGD